jgi:hypothetical protein
MKSAVLPALLVLLLAGSLVASQDFTGTWLGKTEVPEAGINDMTLVIQKKTDAQTKAVTYLATLSDVMGYIPPGTEAGEVKVEGSEMTFSFYIFDGTLISGKLTLKDDVLVGAWMTPEGVGAPMRFERKK